MIATAKAGIENLTAGEVADEMARGGVLLVDVREPTETAKGIIPGAVLAPRGMLEFHADPATPYHLDDFDHQRRTIVYCAAGSRSALARDLAATAWLPRRRPPRRRLQRLARAGAPRRDAGWRVIVGSRPAGPEAARRARQADRARD